EPGRVGDGPRLQRGEVGEALAADEAPQAGAFGGLRAWSPGDLVSAPAMPHVFGAAAVGHSPARRARPARPACPALPLFGGLRVEHASAQSRPVRPSTSASKLIRSA